MKNNNKVTVLCISYNQEKFIAQCLSSILNQKTDFRFKVIIADDASVDQTGDIIKKYQEQYSETLSCIFNEKNIGAEANFKQLLHLINTEYVAICEGDDYWIDMNKLQKQVEFLDNHPEYSICFHPVKVVFEDNSRESYCFPIFRKNKIKKLSLQELLKQNFIQTNSVMYRWCLNNSMLPKLPDHIQPFDWLLHLLHAEKGKIFFMSDVMAVYRRWNNGIWNDINNNLLSMKYFQERLNFYFFLDSYFKYKNFYSIKELLAISIINNNIPELPEQYQFLAEETKRDLKYNFPLFLYKILYKISFGEVRQELKNKFLYLKKLAILKKL